MNKTTINYKRIVEGAIRKAWKVYGYDPKFLEGQKQFNTIIAKGEKIGDYKPNATQLAIINTLAGVVFTDTINQKWQELSNTKQKTLFELATTRALKTQLTLDRTTIKNDVREYELTTRHTLQATFVQLGYILATDNGTTTLKIKNNI